MARELIFEFARMKEGLSKPSRLSSTFSFENFSDAHSYQVDNDLEGRQVLHEVELVDPNLSWHRGCLALLNLPKPEENFWVSARLRAEPCWRGEGEGPVEIVSASALRVIRHY